MELDRKGPPSFTARPDGRKNGAGIGGGPYARLLFAGRDVAKMIGFKMDKQGCQQFYVVLIFTVAQRDRLFDEMDKIVAPMR